jgi:hypothetical protein
MAGLNESARSGHASQLLLKFMRLSMGWSFSRPRCETAIFDSILRWLIAGVGVSWTVEDFDGM